MHTLFAHTHGLMGRFGGDCEERKIDVNLGSRVEVMFVQTAVAWTEVVNVKYGAWQIQLK